MDAEADGYAPVSAYAEFLGLSEVHVRKLMVDRMKQGAVERVKVGKAYWYRRVSEAYALRPNAPLHLQGGATAEPCKRESDCSERS